MRKFAQKNKTLLFVLAIIPLTAFLGVYTHFTKSVNGITVLIQAVLLLIQIVSGIIYFKYN